MYGFDLRQQFGWLVPFLAIVGLFAVWQRSSHRGALMLTLYLVNLLFAFSYNVGDTHVFYLPSHLFIAMLVAPALVLVAETISAGPMRTRVLVAVAGVTTLCRRAHLPGLPGAQSPRRLSARHGARSAHLRARRSARHPFDRPELADSERSRTTRKRRGRRSRMRVCRMCLLYAAALVRDNQAVGRDVALTERASRDFAVAYGPFLTANRDASINAPRLSEIVARLPPKTSTC